MEQITNSLQELYAMRSKCIMEENYLRAEEITKKINTYKQRALSTQKRQFKLQNEQDLKNYEDNYNRQLQLFKDKWIQNEKELNDELNLREQELIAVQKEEMQFLYNNYDKNVKQKQTPSYLNLKKIQYELAKQERFVEAANVKKKAEKLNKDQNEKMKIDAHMQFRKQIDKLQKKHQEEKMRLDDEREKRWYLFQKEKNKEYESIVNKYRSLKMQINYQQKEGQNQALKRLSKFI